MQGLGLLIMQIGINGYEEGKGKDNDSLFNVTYYFNSLGHEILCDITNIHLQILTLLYLPSSTLLIRASTRELLVPYSSLLALCFYKRQPTYFRTQADINAHVLSSK